MYLGNDGSHVLYDSDGTQRHTQGHFLLLFNDPDNLVMAPGDMRACVRQVALEQMGHYMMGTARIGGHSITVSGAYGNNGLPSYKLPRDAWLKYCTPVPDELYKAWQQGGGHNSAGSEAPAMRDWALDNLDALTPS